MDTCRMFLVEKGRFVCIRADGGSEVGFGSLEEFYHYCPVSEFGVDLTGAVRIDYEPDRGIYHDSRDNNVGVKDAPVASYESLIDAVETLRARKADRLWGVTSLEQAKAVKVDMVKREATTRINAKWPDHKQRNVALGLYSEIKDQVAADIQAVIAAVDQAEIDVAAAQDVDAVKAVSPPWPEGI